MLLSVIIPVYNVDLYVGICLDSIYDGAVDEDSFEVIVVNDGSTDDSAATVERYAGRHRNLTILSQENQGLSLARMNGLSRALGEYVWFVDSDDYLAKNAIQSILMLIQTKDAPAVIMTPVSRSDANTGSQRLDYEIDRPRLMDGQNVLLDPRFPQWTASRFILRRDLFDNKWLYFPPGLIHEDEYFGAILLMLAGRVLVHDKVLIHHRFRPGSIMQTISIRSSYDYVSNFVLIRAFAATLPQPSKGAFLRHAQRLLVNSYTTNEKNWRTWEFRRFKCKKGPYIISEFVWNHGLYSFPELASLLFLFVAPNTFRKRFPIAPRQ